MDSTSPNTAFVEPQLSGLPAALSPDHQTLADLFREALGYYGANSPRGHFVQACEGLTFVATEFADQSSVSRSAFLKACGIDDEAAADASPERVREA